MSIKGAATLLLAAMVVGGYLNYQRNVDLIETPLRNRAYIQLSREDLDTLVFTYETELAEMRRWIGEEPSVAHAGVASPHLGDKVRDFERYQHENEDWRTRRSNVLEREIMLDNLRIEQRIRDENLDDPWKRFLKRLLTLSV